MEENKSTNTGGNDLMEDKLRELTEDTQVPASLEPEQIEKMLLKKKKQEMPERQRKVKAQSQKQRSHPPRIMIRSMITSRRS